MQHDTNDTAQSEAARLRTGFPFLDLMFSMQKASQDILSASTGQTDRWSAAKPSPNSTNMVEVIPVGEETLNVEARTMQGNTVRVRRVVVETPVEKQVSLREEKVIVERRKPIGGSTTKDTLTDKAIEMTDTYEVVDAWKSVRLLEEVVLRKEVVERTETVRDTVRHDEVTIERPTVQSITRRNGTG